MTVRSFATLLLFFCNSCFADSAPPERCSSGGLDSQDIYDCSKLRIEAADKELNSTYKDLNSRVSTEYRADAPLGEKLKEHIKTSQIAWIKLRDSNCAVESFVISRETQAFETTKNNCLARETIGRTHYLKNLKF
ncbi:lysozyme inhibitor LprI family protein [Pseudomonas akapageensis]|uniref:lysozyme inhibitor LprI family protein n=1 Tax=Pseudomonas akapageensis TaxID=2609961 RepID=UPI00140C0B95